MGSRSQGLVWSKVWVKETPVGTQLKAEVPGRRRREGRGWRRWASVSRARELCWQESKKDQMPTCKGLGFSSRALTPHGLTESQDDNQGLPPASLHPPRAS